MSLRERLPFITVVTLSIALVTGMIELLPHLRSDDLVLTLEPAAQSPGDSLSISIAGEVQYPGLYEVDAEATLGDVLDRAGCNDYSSTVECNVGGSSATDSPQRINLNRADAWLLEALPGIGPTKAEAIVQYRSTHGPFAYVEQLSQVKGIGDSTIEEISPFVTVTGT